MGGHIVRAATFVYRATSEGVRLSVPVKQGDTLVLREWALPGGTGSLSMSSVGGQEVVRHTAVPLGNPEDDTVQLVRRAITTSRPGVLLAWWND